MVFYRQHRLLYFFLFLLLSVLMGCAKTKFSNEQPQDNLLNISNSNIRLFNISQRDLSVVVNNTVLAMQRSNDLEPENISTIGKLIFPDGIWKNKTAFSIPALLLDKSGGAHLSIPPIGTPIRFRDTVIQNDPVHPRDYYLLPTGNIATFPRNNTPPVNPQHFKIRIVNLGDPNSDFNVGGPVSLTYADGAPVDPKLMGIANGLSSGYAEIPYGAYQFKLFAGVGTQIDFKRQLVTDNFPPAANFCTPGVLPQEGFMPPVATFKPGGVYTVMVINSLFTYDFICNGNPDRQSRMGNAYQVITDLDPGSNLSYARISAINTIPGKKIVVKVNGRSLGEGPMPYIGDRFQTKAIPAEYLTVIQGNQHIQAFDETGNLLAETDYQLYPFDNITCWVRNDASGKAAIIFTSNDMTSTLYKTRIDSNEPPDDGTNGERRRTRSTYAWQSRFMNFVNDQPAITFTNDGQLFLPSLSGIDTLRFLDAYTNLQPGYVPAKNGSIIYRLPNALAFKADGTPDDGSANLSDLSYFPEKIWVNNSSGGLLPGILQTQITPITCNNTFIANDGMYSTTYTKRRAENGIYTMALVGGVAGAAPKIIVIKHNK